MTLANETPIDNPPVPEPPKGINFPENYPEEYKAKVDTYKRFLVKGSATDLDYAKVLQSYVDLERFLGKKESLVSIPDKGSSKETWQGFYKKLGMPEKVEEYAKSTTDKHWESLKKDAMDLGILPHQFNGLAAMAVKNREETAKKAELEMQQNIENAFNTQVKDVWKNEFDSKMSKVKQVAKELLDSNEFEGLEKANAFKNPMLVKLLDKVSDAFLDDKIKISVKDAVAGTPDYGKEYKSIYEELKNLPPTAMEQRKKLMDRLAVISGKFRF